MEHKFEKQNVFLHSSSSSSNPFSSSHQRRTILPRQPSSSSSIIFANNHLLAHIFGYVDHVDLCLSCSLVCRKWKTEADADALWFMLYFMAWGPNATSAVAAQMQQQQQQQQHTSTSNAQNIDSFTMRRDLQTSSQTILHMKWKQHYARKHIIERSFGPAVSRLLSHLSCFKEPYVRLLLAEVDKQLATTNSVPLVAAPASWYKNVVKDLSFIRQLSTEQQQPPLPPPPQQQQQQLQQTQSSEARVAAQTSGQPKNPFGSVLFKCLTQLCAVREQALILLVGGDPTGLLPQQAIAEGLPFVTTFLRFLSDMMPFIYQCINRLIIESSATTTTTATATTTTAAATHASTPSNPPTPSLNFHQDLYCLVQTGLAELITNVETAATNAAASSRCPSASTLVTKTATQILRRFLLEPPAGAPELLRLLRQKAQESMDRVGLGV